MMVNWVVWGYGTRKVKKSVKIKKVWIFTGLVYFGWIWERSGAMLCGTFIC
jgi:hypothetical protein